MSKLRLDFTGFDNGRLLVLARYGLPGERVKWVCICHCGSFFIAGYTALRRGPAWGCHACVCAAHAENARKYEPAEGKLRKATRSSWGGMMARCYSDACLSYERYGGRGIVVCERWHDFPSFLSDMGLRPEGRTLDRIDSNGNYEPGNCRWATPEVQAANKRNSVLLTIDGKTVSLTEAARAAGVTYSCALRRYHEGCPVNEILSTGTVRRSAAIHNPASHGKAGLKGVSARRGKWRATITVDRRQRTLGTFDSPELARQAYVAALREQYGPAA